MSLISEIIKALVDIGISIYEGVRSGSVHEWTPIINKFPDPLRSRIYHETRASRMRGKVEEILGQPTSTPEGASEDDEG